MVSSCCSARRRSSSSLPSAQSRARSVTSSAAGVPSGGAPSSSLERPSSNAAARGHPCAMPAHKRSVISNTAGRADLGTWTIVFDGSCCILELKLEGGAGKSAAASAGAAPPSPGRAVGAAAPGWLAAALPVPRGPGMTSPSAGGRTLVGCRQRLQHRAPIRRNPLHVVSVQTALLMPTSSSLMGASIVRPACIAVKCRINPCAPESGFFRHQGHQIRPPSNGEGASGAGLGPASRGSGRCSVFGGGAPV